MTDQELSTDGLHNNWEFVTWSTPFGFCFPTRIVKCRTQNIIGMFNYKVQRKYWFIGWRTLANFSTDGRVGG